MIRSRFLVLAVTLAAAAPAALSAQVNARMFRQPDVSATHIAFVYAGDIWVVPKTGGTAVRLSSPRGEESFPRFSPDGGRIAYSANYDGNTDVYVVPASGGEPVRVTHHPMGDRLVDWYPDGRSLLVATSMESGRQRYSQFFRVSATGGLPARLPVPYGEFASLSSDGQRVAYVPMSQSFRTWKRYRGGWAADIWTFDLRTMASERVAVSEANDEHPMWHGRTLYFMSDRDASQRANIWAYDTESRQLRQVTRFTDFDITFPSLGPSDIVFEAGGRLYLLDLASEQTREVQVNVVTDLATLRPRAERVGNLIQGAAISPTGQRALFTARGEVFSVPARYGPVMNLTQSPGAAERYPAWSPDGRQVAYWSDRSGEYELYLRPAEGGAERKVTSLGRGFRYRPYWSPDSRKIAFVDQTMTVYVLDVESGRATRVDQGLYWSHGPLEFFRPSWSADSRWLAYGRDLPNRKSAILLFDTRAGRGTQVTSGYYNDYAPEFDPDGKYLYFYTDRTLRPVYSDIDNTWVYPNATNIAAVALRPDVASPLAPRNDMERPRADTAAGRGADTTQAARGRPGAAARAGAAADTATRRPAAPAPVEIDTAGFERRLVLLPPTAGNFGALRAVSGKVLFRRLPVSGSTDTITPVVYYDLTEREEKTVIADADDFEVSHDGKKVLVRDRQRFGIIDIKENQRLQHPLRVQEMEMMVDPRAEWRQLFADVWRFQRDYFYDPTMHGVDWNAMRDRYGRLLDDAVTRWDVNFVIGELISELNASHTYRGGGDLETPPDRAVGLLGVDWELENGAYRIARIIEGAPWDAEVRSPLSRPGVNVRPGDYLLAVNGVPVDVTRDPWAAFQGLAGVAVELMVNNRPTSEGARRVVVETLRDETRLRHLAWIEANRRRVDEATNGRVGYVYVPSTGIDGQTELVRQFAFQFTKDALIVDERFNSGGQIPDRFIEVLNRPPLVNWAVRDGRDWQWPPIAHYGPKVMLINGWSGSGGDAFPNYFREARLGPLIGMRTWGGLIGISGVPPLIDGGGVTVPTFRQYSTRGEWFAEGHGVEPDIEVLDDPTQLARGTDPQLERAIQESVRLLQERPYLAPRRPPYENRTAGAPGQPAQPRAGGQERR
jgi:tricorn protease